MHLKKHVPCKVGPKLYNCMYLHLYDCDPECVIVWSMLHLHECDSYSLILHFFALNVFYAILPLDSLLL